MRKGVERRAYRIQSKRNGEAEKKEEGRLE